MEAGSTRFAGSVRDREISASARRWSALIDTAMIRRAATMASPCHPCYSIPHIANNIIPSYNILTIWNLSTSTAFPKYWAYGLCSEIDLVVPSMDDRIAVEVIDELGDALFQLVFCGDADVAEHGQRGICEQILD